MIINQVDIARLSDDTIRRMILGLLDGQDVDVRRYSHRTAVALQRALKERQRLLLLAEAEYAAGDDEAGGLHQWGEDPEIDAILAQLIDEHPGPRPTTGTDDP